MSREIKFRAYDKETNEMSYDFLDKAWLRVAIESPYVELMQYTGLKDKNGVEIYEGDIVQNRRTSSAGQAAYKVIWHEYGGEWGFEPFPLAGNKPFTNRVLLEDWEMIDDAEVVIIGNIYENPELLEDTHE